MRVLLLAILLSAVPAMAWELEAFGGARSVTFDDVEEANSTGFSFRSKINLYNENRGLFIHVTSNFYTIGGGYGWRTSGDWFFEAGAGLAYGLIGPTPLVVLGTGYRFADGWFLNFPLIYSGLVYWSPYIGYTF